MKTFGLIEVPEGMRECVKRPIIVKALKMTEDFRVKSLEGDFMVGKAGSFLMKDIDGNNYICEENIFNRMYDFLDEV